MKESKLAQFALTLLDKQVKNSALPRIPVNPGVEKMTLTNRQRPLSVFLLLLFILTISFAAQAQPTSTQLNANLLAEFKWRLVGPSSPAGCVWQVVGDENDPKTFYVCTAGGGLWKSTDNGIPCLGSQKTGEGDRREKLHGPESKRFRSVMRWAGFRPEITRSLWSWAPAR